MMASIATGIWFGLCWDTYERISGVRQVFRWTRAVNDILFWLAQMLIYFIILLHVNNGDIRFYLLLALLLGYAVYRAIFERFYRRWLERILLICSRTQAIFVRLTHAFILNPTKGILKLIFSSSMIVITTIWRLFSYLAFCIFRPIFRVVQFADRQMGQPFIKQRRQTAFVIKKWYNRFINKHGYKG